MPSLLLFLGCVCFLGGCVKQSSRATIHTSSSEQPDICEIAKQDPLKDLSIVSPWVEKSSRERAYSIRQREAQLIDVAIPINAVSLGCHEDQLANTDKDSLVLAYRVYLKSHDIKSFFMLEMERLGWNMIARVDNIESLLVFSKPTKVCTISLRKFNSQDASSLIVITYANNKASDSTL